MNTKILRWSSLALAAVLLLALMCGTAAAENKLIGVWKSGSRYQLTFLSAVDVMVVLDGAETANTYTQAGSCVTITGPAAMELIFNGFTLKGEIAGEAVSFKLAERITPVPTTTPALPPNATAAPEPTPAPDMSIVGIYAGKSGMNSMTMSVLEGGVAQMQARGITMDFTYEVDPENEFVMYFTQDLGYLSGGSKPAAFTVPRENGKIFFTFLGDEYELIREQDLADVTGTWYGDYPMPGQIPYKATLNLFEDGTYNYRVDVIYLEGTWVKANGGVLLKSEGSVDQQIRFDGTHLYMTIGPLQEMEMSKGK